MIVQKRSELPPAARDHATAPEDGIHPAWLSLMRFCREMGHGELERIKIQDGLPVVAEVTTRKVKFP